MNLHEQVNEVAEMVAICRRKLSDTLKLLDTRERQMERLIEVLGAIKHYTKNPAFNDEKVRQAVGNLATETLETINSVR